MAITTLEEAPGHGQAVAPAAMAEQLMADQLMAEQLLALAEAAGRALREHGLTLVTAESCTAGGVAYAITQVAGSSAWFDRGFVTYTNTAKSEQLDVPAALLAAHGAVSEPVVAAMAVGALSASEAQVAVAVSGIAGPGGGSPDKPVGTVCFAWARSGEADAPPLLVTVTQRLAGDRAAVRSAAIVVALEGIVKLMRGLQGSHSGAPQ